MADSITPHLFEVLQAAHTAARPIDICIMSYNGVNFAPLTAQASEKRGDFSRASPNVRPFKSELMRIISVRLLRAYP